MGTRSLYLDTGKSFAYILHAEGEAAVSLESVPFASLTVVGQDFADVWCGRRGTRKSNLRTAMVLRQSTDVATQSTDFAAELLVEVAEDRRELVLIQFFIGVTVVLVEECL